MGDLPLPASSVPGLSTSDRHPVPQNLARSTPLQPSDNLAVFEVLRQALTDNSQSSDSILSAVADAARVLTGADGAAIALRTNGEIVCRTRSGDMAPEIGTPLNTDSGISGECLRTATILVCHDAHTDDRVDPDVCRDLGIRSLVVVPLRGRMGMLGILEAFSVRPDAFQEEQIDWLRSLSEIAEATNERDRLATSDAIAAAAASTNRPAFFGVPRGADESTGDAPRAGLFAKRYWIIAGSALLLLLVGIIVRMSWRETGAEIDASGPPSETRRALGGTSRHPAAGVGPEKPAAALGVRQTDRSHTKNKDLPQNAADIERAPDKPVPSHSEQNRAEDNTRTVRRNSASLPSEPPPSIQIAQSTAPTNELSLAASGAVPLPEFGAKISTGAVEPHLIRKVDPVYPQRARIQGLTGTVILDATIAADGSVHTIRVLSGPTPLAEAATTAIQQWLYKPGLLNGKPVETQKRITVVFKLP